MVTKSCGLHVFGVPEHPVNATPCGWGTREASNGMGCQAEGPCFAIEAKN